MEAANTNEYLIETMAVEKQWNELREKGGVRGVRCCTCKHWLDCEEFYKSGKLGYYEFIVFAHMNARSQYGPYGYCKEIKAPTHANEWCPKAEEGNA